MASDDAGLISYGALIANAFNGLVTDVILCDLVHLLESFEATRHSLCKLVRSFVEHERVGKL